MNKVILIGRLTKDPDIHYTQSQNVTCNFTLAVNREFKNQNGQYEADFIPVVLWGKTAEAAGNSLAKGHRLCVEGRMQVRTYEDKQGKTVWVTEVIGNRIEFLERKRTRDRPPLPHRNSHSNHRSQNISNRMLSGRMASVTWEPRFPLMRKFRFKEGLWKKEITSHFFVLFSRWPSV